MAGKAAKAASAPAFTEDEIRRILLEHRYLLDADAITKKWGITRNRLRAWKKEHGFEYLRGGLRELVIVALRACPVRDPADLVAFLDMVDHSVYSEEEITSALDGLVTEGIAEKKNGTWRYDEDRLARERFAF
jgi:hypothetical protein